MKYIFKIALGLLLTLGLCNCEPDKYPDQNIELIPVTAITNISTNAGKATYKTDKTIPYAFNLYDANKMQVSRYTDEILLKMYPLEVRENKSDVESYSYTFSYVELSSSTNPLNTNHSYVVLASKTNGLGTLTYTKTSGDVSTIRVFDVKVTLKSIYN